MIEWAPLILTFELALITTVFLLVISIPLAYWLNYTRIKIKPVIETLVSMPIVLPPTVLGFYLLAALICLILSSQVQNSTISLLAGIFTSLSAFAKSEGQLAALLGNDRQGRSVQRPRLAPARKSHGQQAHNPECEGR